MPFGKTIIKPTDNLIYNVELPRLSVSIEKCFQRVKKDRTIQGIHILENSLATLFTNSLTRVGYSAYLSGLQQVSYPLDKSDELRLARDNKARAIQAASWISHSTATALDISAALDFKQAMSKLRASTDAANELKLALYRGFNKGWTANPKARKEWWLSNGHDNDDTCDDNADEGPIKPNQAFQSGHFEPPAHLRCECNLVLVFAK